MLGELQFNVNSPVNNFLKFSLLPAAAARGLPPGAD
jgi:hypothetical protein